MRDFVVFTRACRQRGRSLSSVSYLALGFLALTVSGHSARAQIGAEGTSGASGTALEEVIVTAVKRSTDSAAGTKSNMPLIETPQSITVIPRALLDLQNP